MMNKVIKGVYMVQKRRGRCWSLEQRSEFLRERSTGFRVLDLSVENKSYKQVSVKAPKIQI